MELSARLRTQHGQDVWTLSSDARAALRHSQELSEVQINRDSLQYHRPEDGSLIVAQWLDTHERITTTDYATMTAFTTQGARNQLDQLAAAGALERGVGMGRNSHCTAGHPSTLNRPLDNTYSQLGVD